MEKYTSFRKLLKSKAPKTDPCSTPKISSKKVLHTLFIRTDCFLFLKHEYINESGHQVQKLGDHGLCIQRH